MLSILAEICLLIVALLFFYQSLRILRNDILRVKDASHTSKVVKIVQVFGGILGLALWFVAGLIAFISSVSALTNHLILRFQ